MIRLGWFLEKTHDLERLLDALREHHSDLVTPIEPLCDALNEAYFGTRYPGFDLEDPNWPDLRDTLEKVTALLQAVRAHLP